LRSRTHARSDPRLVKPEEPDPAHPTKGSYRVGGSPEATLNVPDHRVGGGYQNLDRTIHSKTSGGCSEQVSGTETAPTTPIHGTKALAMTVTWRPS
jgi:hypothetical protein